MSQGCNVPDGHEFDIAFYVNFGIPQPGFVHLTFMYRHDEDWWMGTCLELGTATYDRDRATMIQELQALVVAELNGLEADGERERVFRDRQINLLLLPQTTTDDTPIVWQAPVVQVTDRTSTPRWTPKSHPVPEAVLA